MSDLDHPAWCAVAFGRRWEGLSYSLNQHGFIMNLRTISVATCFAALSMTAIAQTSPGQQPPSPEQMRAMMQVTMQATMGVMTAAMGPMTEAVIEAQLIDISIKRDIPRPFGLTLRQAQE